MAKTLLNDRNKAVREYFTALAKKNTQWRFDALEEETAKKFFLSARTVRAILKEEGNYNKT